MATWAIERHSINIAKLMKRSKKNLKFKNCDNEFCTNIHVYLLRYWFMKICIYFSLLINRYQKSIYGMSIICFRAMIKWDMICLSIFLISPFCRLSSFLLPISLSLVPTINRYRDDSYHRRERNSLAHEDHKSRMGNNGVPFGFHEYERGCLNPLSEASR